MEEPAGAPRAPGEPPPAPLAQAAAGLDELYPVPVRAASPGERVEGKVANLIARAPDGTEVAMVMPDGGGEVVVMPAHQALRRSLGLRVSAEMPAVPGHQVRVEYPPPPAPPLQAYAAGRASAGVEVTELAPGSRASGRVADRDPVRLREGTFSVLLKGRGSREVLVPHSPALEAARGKKVEVSRPQVGAPDQAVRVQKARGRGR